METGLRPTCNTSAQVFTAAPANSTCACKDQALRRDHGLLRKATCFHEEQLAKLGSRTTICGVIPRTPHGVLQTAMAAAAGADGRDHDFAAQPSLDECSCSTASSKSRCRPHRTRRSFAKREAARTLVQRNAVLLPTRRRREVVRLSASIDASSAAGACAHERDPLLHVSG